MKYLDSESEASGIETFIPNTTTTITTTITITTTTPSKARIVLPSLKKRSIEDRIPKENSAQSTTQNYIVICSCTAYKVLRSEESTSTTTTPSKTKATFLFFTQCHIFFPMIFISPNVL
ncbi:hypothetical protein E2C01_029869 [Portunus trituberculatus]|uniref:Uncharacterized protein n=1 Tax=Portunus trituberculatus TaxID=210409 RepID=A0A5B7EQH4_PORTR|nr:hypothetical protein [Portunus trituberculatus]